MTMPDDVRDFPYNTCGASRTVQQWADEIDRAGIRVLMDQDPSWVAETLRAVVVSLWTCRTFINKSTADYHKGYQQGLIDAHEDAVEAIDDHNQEENNGPQY